MHGVSAWSSKAPSPGLRLAQPAGAAARDRSSAVGRPASGTVRRIVGPFARGGHELQLTADQLGALAHPRHPEPALQAVAPRSETVGFRKPLTVVGHRRADHARRARTTLIVALRRLRVAAHVRQRLLYHAIDRALKLSVQAMSGDLRSARAPDRGRSRSAPPGRRSPARAAPAPARAAAKPEIVERRRAKLGDQVAQPVDLVAEPFQHSLHRGAQRRPARRGRARWPASSAAPRGPESFRRESPAPSACARARAPPCRSAGD